MLTGEIGRRFVVDATNVLDTRDAAAMKSSLK
jgi:hypothetical protein